MAFRSRTSLRSRSNVALLMAVAAAVVSILSWSMTSTVFVAERILVAAMSGAICGTWELVTKSPTGSMAESLEDFFQDTSIVQIGMAFLIMGSCAYTFRELNASKQRHES